MQGKEKVIFLWSAVALCLTAFFSLGYYHPDEHYQLLEFARTKLYPSNKVDLPWEYAARMRPAFQPFIAFVVAKMLELMHVTNPFAIARCLRMLSALLAFCAMYSIYTSFKTQFESALVRKWFLLLSFFYWFLLFDGVRFSSENWSGSLFMLALGCYFLYHPTSTQLKQGKPFYGLYFGIGLLMGGALLCRLQTILLVAGFLCWLVVIQKEKFNILLKIVVGIAGMIGVGIILDKWLYGQWVNSFWNYYLENMVRGKAASFGVAPWYYYLVEFFNQGIPPFSLGILVAFASIVVFRMKSFITWTILPFFVVHCLIAHKELRFLFPLAGFIPLILVEAITIAGTKLGKGDRFIKGFMRLFFIVNFLLVAVVAFRPANGTISLFEKIYSTYPQATVLYYSDDNPYNSPIKHFYKRSNLSFRAYTHIDSIQQLRDTTSLVVFSNKTLPANFERSHKLVYCSLPDWVRNFNFNHWVERTDLYYVFEL